MQLQVTRDLTTRSLKLGLDLSVREQGVLNRADLLTYDLGHGHTVADLQMGWAGICKTVGEMVDMEHAVRTKLDTLNRYIRDDTKADQAVATIEVPSEVPDHEHPHEVRGLNLLNLAVAVLTAVVVILTARTEYMLQLLNKVAHAW